MQRHTQFYRWGEVITLREMQPLRETHVLPFSIIIEVPAGTLPPIVSQTLPGPGDHVKRIIVQETPPDATPDILGLRTRQERRLARHAIQKHLARGHP